VGASAVCELLARNAGSWLVLLMSFGGAMQVYIYEFIMLYRRNQGALRAHRRMVRHLQMRERASDHRGLRRRPPIHLRASAHRGGVISSSLCFAVNQCHISICALRACVSLAAASTSENHEPYHNWDQLEQDEPWMEKDTSQHRAPHFAVKFLIIFRAFRRTSS
jgi:hypothetical protein